MTLLFDVFLPVLVIFIMTMVGMDLRYEDFLRVRRYPLLVPTIIVGQWAAATLVAGLVGKLLELSYALAGGALLVAAAPVAALSNYYAQLSNGHLALAVTVTAISTVVAIALTPLTASAGFALFMGSATTVDLPLLRIAQQTIVGLVLPLLAGMLIRQRAPAWSLRWRRRLQMLAFAASVAIFVLVVVAQFTAIYEQWVQLVGASLLYTFALMVVAVVVTRLARLDHPDCWALVWGFPARNLAVAALIATTVVGQLAMATFGAVLFAVHLATMIPLALWIGRSDGRHGAA
ncbi:MAG TPA: hypothetical protein PLW68_10860 [Casimicrobiaceae bacterium]|nr:hypothetical protein [Casimicrobiaceae bacterium]